MYFSEIRGFLNSGVSGTMESFDNKDEYTIPGNKRIARRQVYQPEKDYI